MATPTEYWADPAATVDTGDGTSKANAWGPRTGGKAAVQHALDTITQGAGGDRINVVAGTDDTLNAALTLATYGTPTSEKPIIIQGATTTAGDLGVGGIDGAATYSIMNNTGYNNVHFVDMHLHNCGSQKILLLNDECSVVRCEVNNSTAYAIECDVACTIQDCNIHNHGGLLVDTETHVIGNYIVADGTITTILQTGGDGVLIAENILTQVSGADTGIYLLGNKHMCRHNSVLGATASGIAIRAFTNAQISQLIGNLVDGFSSGTGIDMAAMNQRILRNYRYNAVNGGTEYGTDPDHIIGEKIDNESLSVTPFAKSGSDTFANRFTYFAPADTGNVLGGLPNGRDKGAVQSSGGGGGGASGGAKSCGRGGGFVA
jgi:hypothetical protein